MNRFVIHSAMIFTLLPGVVLAKPLTITNSTKVPITVRVHGECSREFGLIRVLTSSTVDEAALNRLCRNDAAHCFVEIFNSTTCQDKFMGYFYFHTVNGPSGEGSTVPPYKMVVRNYQVVFSQ